jgi:HlyD family secretion protein
MKRTVLFVILGVVLVAAAGYWFVWRPRQTEVETEVRSATVERGTLLVAVSASGSIEPQSRVDLVLQLPGRAAEVAVEVGDRVRAGDVLVRLDSKELALQVEQARAALTSAEARLGQLQGDARPEEVESAEANVRAVEAQLSAAHADLAQLQAGATGGQIAAAEAEVASALTRQRQANDAHDMTMKCVTFKIPGTGTKKTICPALGAPEEQARYNLNLADSSLAAAQAQLDDVLAGADVNAVRAARANVAAVEAQRDAAQAQLDMLVAGATAGQTAAAKAQVAQAEAALELAELVLEKATLYAPFDGVIAAVNVTAGEMAPAGRPAITLLDTSEFHMTVGVDELDVGRLVVGQAARVSLDAIPEANLTGEVERIAPAATRDGGVVTYDVEIALEETDAPVRADMTANATIVVEELSDVLKIPTWVVRVDKDTGQTYVNQREGGEIVRTDVALGIRYEGIAQVLSGLSEGDEAIWVEDSSFGFGPHGG